MSRPVKVRNAVHISVYVAPFIAKKLRELATDRSCPVSDLMREAVDQYLGITSKKPMLARPVTAAQQKINEVFLNQFQSRSE